MRKFPTPTFDESKQQYVKRAVKANFSPKEAERHWGPALDKRYIEIKAATPGWIRPIRDSRDDW